MKKIMDKTGAWTGAILFEGKEQSEVVQALQGREEELRAAVAVVRAEAEKQGEDYLAAHERILASFEESVKVCERLAEELE